MSISSQESDSELTAMNSAIVHFARLQETTSEYALTLCHAVFPMLRLPALLPPASQYALTLCHAVISVLRLRALLCPALSTPASQCAPGPIVSVGRDSHRHVTEVTYDIAKSGSHSECTVHSYSKCWK